MRNAKIFAGIFTFIFGLSFFSSFCGAVDAAAGFAPEFTVYSEGVFMINLDTDIVVFQKNANEKFYPASTTKIMTAIVAMENISDLDAYVTIGYDATNEFWEGDPNKEGPSNAALEAGQTNITYRDCLYTLMVASACESANILAINTFGSIEAFVSKMNEKAAQLGCANTHFSNTHGLWEEDNYSTPYDMYLISKYAYEKVPGFVEMCDTTEWALPANKYNPDGYTKYTTNVLIRNVAENPFYYEYAHGIKTGSIDYYWDSEGNKHEGGRCLVSTAKKNGYNYMLVTMWAPYFDEDGNSYNYPALDHVNLYKWVFDTFQYTTVLTTNDVVGEIAVEQGDGADHVTLSPSGDYSTLLPYYLDLSTVQQVIEKPDTIKAPIERGQVLGSIELRLGGETLTTVDLIANRSIERSQIAYITEQIQSVIDTAWFKALVIILILLILADVVLICLRNRQRRIEEKRKARKSRNMYR